MAALARIMKRPRPVLVGFDDSARPWMMPPVGKSGPCTNFKISASWRAGLFTSVMVASTISVRLCGGILVAMPTAMPSDPLTSRFGIRAGRTSGSTSLSS